MQKRPPPSAKRSLDSATDQVPADRAQPDTITDEALPLDEIGDAVIAPTEPPVVTARDDDEDGADLIDPETGLPYEETHPGTEGPLVDRTDGTSEP